MRTIINFLLLLAGIGILALLVILAGPSKIVDAAKDVHIGYMLAGVFLFLFALVVRAARWYILLKYLKTNITFTRFLPLYFLNFMISNATPARSGEALAPFLLKRHIGSSTGEGFSVVLVDRIVDLICVVFITVCGFSYYVTFANLPHAVNKAFYIAIAILVAFLSLILIFVLSKRIALSVLSVLAKFFSTPRIQSLRNGLDSFYRGLDTLKKLHIQRLLLLLATFSWMLVATSFFLRIRAILNAPFSHIIASWAISIGIGTASFIPSSLGSGQASFAYLISLLQFDIADAVAAALLSKFAALGIIYISGLSSLLWIRR